MGRTRKIIWWIFGLVVLVVGIIVTIALFPRGETITIEYDEQYPELDPNERLPDTSFGWGRPGGFNPKFEFDGSFPEMPEKMLVYKTVPPKNVTEAYVRELAQNYFDMPTDAGFNRNGRYYKLKTEAYIFQFDSSTGFFNIFKYEEARAKLSKDRKDYPTNEECKRIAREYLKERGLLPEDAYLSGLTDCNINSVGAMCVWFARTIDGYKTCGPGSEILIEIGVDGEITKVSKRWLELEPYKLAPIITAKEAFKELQHGNPFLATSGGKVTKITLAYLTPPGGAYIQPVYYFEFDGSGAYAFVPAVKEEYIMSGEEMEQEIERLDSRWQSSGTAP